MASNEELGNGGYLYEPDISDYPQLVQDNNKSDSSSDSDSENISHFREGRVDKSVSTWCTCGLCVIQKTDEECFCCKEHELMTDIMDMDNLQCFTHKTDLAEYIAHRPSLEMAYIDALIKKHVVGPAPDQLSNRQYRLMAYRLFTRYIHKGQLLGRHVRKPIPSCCVEYIHKKFPEPNAVYVGFQYYKKNTD